MTDLNLSNFESLHDDMHSRKRKSLIKLDKKKKNILLVGPQSLKEDAERSFMAPALGVIRLAGYLNQNGHFAEHFEPNLVMLTNKGKKIEEILKEKNWDIIGFSILEETLISDVKNMQLAEKTNPNALMIAGGIEAQFNYQTILDKTPCNIVIISEGEKSLLSIANGENLHEIPGIVFKNNSKPLDENTFNQATSAIEWEKLPYEEYWDYYIKKYGDKITDENLKEIQTVRIFSRNRCPIGCKFCSSTNQITWGSDEKVPVISASHETLIHNIKRIIESHPRVRTIYLTDDDFCINKKDVIRFCKKVVEEDFKDLTFMSFCRASDATDEMFNWLKKANWRRLNIGIESFSDKVLKDMRKRCTKEQNHEALRLAKKNGIPAFLNFIVTTPESTLDDVKKTVNGALPYAKDSFFHVGITIAVKPLKGTDYFEEYSDYMTRIVNIPNSQYKVKVDDIIYANDPKVKMLQLRYWDEIDDCIKSQREKKEIKHHVASNLSLVKLELLVKLIDEIENQFKNKKTINSKLHKSKSMPRNERQTVDIHDEVDEDKKKFRKSTHGSF